MSRRPRGAHQAWRRAALLRARGEARLQAFLNAEVGAMRDILVETPDTGRTPHFALARFETAMAPGAVIKARVLSASANHLTVGM